MTAEDILQQLEELGTEQTKKILLKHGIPEPLYGVKVEELKKINKKVKNGNDIALKLYDSGVYDAMYLAGLMAEPGKMSAAQLQKWAKKATSPAIREYTVSWVAAESDHGLEKALEWIDSSDEHLASTGWSTLSSIVTITDDRELDIPQLKKLIDRVAKNIGKSPERVKYTMNGFLMATGIHVAALNEAAKQAALKIGKFTINMGDTACKVPYAVEYIEKAEGKGVIGKKKKSARCL